MMDENKRHPVRLVLTIDPAAADLARAAAASAGVDAELIEAALQPGGVELQAGRLMDAAVAGAGVMDLVRAARVAPVEGGTDAAR